MEAVTAIAFAPCKSPVEQLPRRACAAELTDSRVPRASHSTRGTTHPARHSSPQKYCDMLHDAEDSVEKLAPFANPHASAPGRRAGCACRCSWRLPPIRLSHQSTGAVELSQPRCTMLQLRRAPCFSQLCAAQRASSAAPGGPMACSASREAEAGRVSASRAGGHAPRTGERVARKSASCACFCVTDAAVLQALKTGCL